MKFKFTLLKSRARVYVQFIFWISRRPQKIVFPFPPQSVHRLNRPSESFAEDFFYIEKSIRPFI